MLYTNIVWSTHTHTRARTDIHEHIHIHLYVQRYGFKPWYRLHELHIQKPLYVKKYNLFFPLQYETNQFTLLQ